MRFDHGKKINQMWHGLLNNIHFKIFLLAILVQWN